MPFIYGCSSKNVADTFVTHGTGGTEIDFAFWKAGATRVLTMIALMLQGRGAGLTSLSGLDIRLKVWGSTASSGGTAVTPAPKDNRAPAAVATCGMGTGGGTNAVTSGTGGPTIPGTVGSGASGPSGWVALSPDEAIVLDGNTTKSVDGFSACGTSGIPFSFEGKLQE